MTWLRLNIAVLEQRWEGEKIEMGRLPFTVTAKLTTYQVSTLFIHTCIMPNTSTSLLCQQNAVYDNSVACNSGKGISMVILLRRCTEWW